MPNTPIKMPSFLEEPNNTTSPTCFAQFYQPEVVCIHESSCLQHSTKVALRNNEPSVRNKHSPDSSIIVDKLEIGEQVTQKLNPMDKKRRYPDGSSMSSAQSKDVRELKGKKKKRSSVGMKDGDQAQSKPTGNKKDGKKVVEEAPTGYIHVRARRGQATDSHSLAERVRREKIKEKMKLLQAIVPGCDKMKLLQAIVPGCDKVTGKAHMLDEIINYVQSLQNQVEFLSMKLASLNPMFYDFGMDTDGFMARHEPTGFSNRTNSFTTENNYPLVDSSNPLLFQQGQLLNNLSQATGQLLWDIDEQRQKFINQSGFSNNLCSFY
ncbi:unnamed protein product [Ilex paraguariensis]|uniref:BHLH domain-containing protein n=1 Tax=Ilex paraguariensis TaxID=185542 RepID=A0ABC8U7Z6_9AQUA